MCLASLDAEHVTSFEQALANLSTPNDEFTYAHIVDGMPINGIYTKEHGSREGFPGPES